ncbi:peptidoglycan recognition protein family protein [Salipaludibacillus aurantiacus]|uniref:Autolysin n=1 Tax=Salipaludibacillus aurantiacus TaxID=1601833 RepID=A0A1H9X9C7_9BACI|nr:N-acetylmuramoyl-L-alanine amidase [Salipaludibacillus aurantiacus]SES42681.1 N-acetylmuramoyl-L-alanine amidase [Salipaludibacillus aurantiacus]
MWMNGLTSRLEDLRSKLPVHRNKTYLKSKEAVPQYLTIHHSGTKTGDAFSFAKYHVNHHGWPGAGYHFVLTGKGLIQWCHNLNVISYHTKGRNRGNIGICLVGEGDFTGLQRKSLLDLSAALCSYYRLPSSAVLGHREHPQQQTVCPSINMKEFRMELSKAVLQKGEQGTLPPVLRKGMRGPAVTLLQKKLRHAGFPLPGYGIDGIFGNETEQAVRNFQKSRKILQDGIAGPVTWSELLSVKPR